MSEWNVFEIIVALIAFVATVVAPIIKLNTSIVKLTQIVDRMSTELGELTNRNAATHERIFEKLNEHDTRIAVLEAAKENG